MEDTSNAPFKNLDKEKVSAKTSNDGKEETNQKEKLEKSYNVNAKPELARIDRDFEQKF